MAQITLRGSGIVIVFNEPAPGVPALRIAQDGKVVIEDHAPQYPVSIYINPPQ